MNVELDRQKVINVLKSKRLLLGMTQTELAEKVGIKRQVINRWEKQGTAPDSVNLIKTCKVLGLNIYDFLA